MNIKRIYLGLLLTIIGMVGIASMLTMDISLPSEVLEILEVNFSPTQIKWILLINPSILLIIAVLVGILLYQKVNLKVPVLEKWVGINFNQVNYSDILNFGIIGGVITGVLIILVEQFFTFLTPSEFEELGQTLQPTIATRFLYGGFTEEILLRFGLMTLLVWIISKITLVTNNFTFWAGIILSAIFFAIAHFPIVFQSVQSPSFILLSYVLIGNSLGGVVFGWLYWKKGLESAFIAHIFAHVIIVVFEWII